MGEEFIYVLEGAVVPELGEDRYELEPGDSAYCLSTTAHHIAAKSGHATIIAVLYEGKQRLSKIFRLEARVWDKKNRNSNS